MKRFWADYTTHDFARLPRASLVAVLPVAAIEQHGPHLPLATDREILEGLIATTIPLLPEDLPAVFLPVQAVATSDEHRRYPGTLTLSTGTLIRLLVEIGGSVAAAGIRKLVLLNAHGGSVAMLDIVARALRSAHDMVAVAASWWELGLPDGVLSDEERRHGLHAGEMETAMMLALRPELVAMARARDFDSLGHRLERNFHHLSASGGARLGWQAQDLNAAGAVGNAAAATPETGRRLVEHAARAIALLLDDVHRLPVGLLHHPTEL